jgi:hypothetical protein
MGKKDYKGTILDGRDSFDSWRMDLDDSLLSDDLMSYVTTEATVQTSGSSTPGDKSAEDIKKHLSRTNENTTEYRSNPQELGKPPY